METDSIDNYDRERVGNTVTQNEQRCKIETEQRGPRGGKVTGMKEQGNETNREERRKSVSEDRTTCSNTVEIGREKDQRYN